MTAAGTPDIQFFGTSGTWVKPPLAVRVDIVLKGGEAGAVPVLGVNVGQAGELLAQSYAASDLPDRVEVEVGKGGRPGGRDGYALIVTHLADPPLPSVPQHDLMLHAHSHEHDDGEPHEHLHGGPGHMGIEHSHPHRHAPAQASPFAANERALNDAVKQALDDWEQR